jgi:uncharacterized membrane protein
MTKTRLEAFSDGVIAIIITIMVLEMKVPHGTDLAALMPLIPAFLSNVLSFVYVGICWNNHHHMLHAVRHISGGVMWANLHLLFWLSLVPFATGWMGEAHLAPKPVALYGAVLLMCAIAYTILLRGLIGLHGRASGLARVVGRDVEGYVSPAFYVVAIGFAFVEHRVSIALYMLVALIWLAPDRRMEQTG